ncbi:transcription factor bHLH162 isoform X2 [Capsella rubella]|uniref:transcription factor bHLH162 isoform X2 n=1 Tax=Capsella rubella TaxID=81985 RepID=UPI000CD500C8|nr:transcription factor bHLH162 isoform X2 [Capsella rubella]
MEPSHSNTAQSRRSVDRKTIEKNRRMQMKSLYSELISLLPHHSSRTSALPDQLDEAANYIKKLQVNVEKKRERKRKLVATTTFEKLNSAGSSLASSSVDVSVPKRLPKIEIQEMGSILHIFLVTSLEHKFMFGEIIRVLTEELGAEITHAGYSIVDDAVFHTLHCKVEECDYGARSQIPERLEKFVNSVN